MGAGCIKVVVCMVAITGLRGELYLFNLYPLGLKKLIELS